MKRWLIVFLTLISCTALNCEEASSIVTPDWATGEHPEQQKPPPKVSDAKKAAAVIIGTLAAVTVGLLASGYDTGHPSSDAEKAK